MLHVQCRGLPQAKQILQVGLECGFRESGIVLGKKVMVAIRTTAFMLELPLACSGELLVSVAYLRYLVAHANAKFVENQARTDHFFAKLKEAVAQAAGLAGTTSISTGGVPSAETADAVVAPKTMVKAVKTALEDLGLMDRTKRIGPSPLSGADMFAIPLNKGLL